MHQGQPGRPEWLSTYPPIHLSTYLPVYLLILTTANMLHVFVGRSVPASGAYRQVRFLVRNRSVNGKRRCLPPRRTGVRRWLPVAATLRVYKRSRLPADHRSTPPTPAAPEVFVRPPVQHASQHCRYGGLDVWPSHSPKSPGSVLSSGLGGKCPTRTHENGLGGLARKCPSWTRAQVWGLARTCP